MLLKLIKDSLNGINMICFISVDQDIIQIESHKNVQFFDQNFINIALETCRYIG